MVSMWLIQVMFNLDDLVTEESARFLHYKISIFSSSLVYSLEVCKFSLHLRGGRRWRVLKSAVVRRDWINKWWSLWNILLSAVQSCSWWPGKSGSLKDIIVFPVPSYLFLWLSLRWMPHIKDSALTQRCATWQVFGGEERNFLYPQVTAPSGLPGPCLSLAHHTHIPVSDH